VKTHRFLPRGITACGVDQGVNAADMQPPEVTCLRCLKVPPTIWDGHHYAYARTPEACRVFVVDGLPPDPTRPWTAVFEGPLA